jgi:hypothetical protein
LQEEGELAELGMPGEGKSQEEKSGLGEFPVRRMVRKTGHRKNLGVSRSKVA